MYYVIKTPGKNPTYVLCDTDMTTENFWIETKDGTDHLCSRYEDDYSSYTIDHGEIMFKSEYYTEAAANKKALLAIED